MKSLLITRNVLDPVIEAAKERFEVTVRPTNDGMSVAECVEALESYDAILPTIGDQFVAEAFEKADPIRCGVLGNFGVGYNHIDDAAAAAHGVAVSNTPDVLTDATADTGLLLLLATARRASEGERLVRSVTWSGFGPRDMLGVHVTGKTIGVVGMGRIGQAVAHRAHFGFGMDVLYFNRSQKSVDMPARQVGDIAELMAGSDFIVVTVPGGAETTKLIDKAAIAAMKTTGILVNIARGEVVDETALIEALEAGSIGGAGLDVYEAEPHVPERLRALDNVFLLPHLGSATVETRVDMGMLALDNITAWAEGKPLPTRVN